MPIVSANEELVSAGSVRLVIPNIVVSEFERNKDDVAEKARRRLSQEFKQASSVVEEFGGDLLHLAEDHGSSRIIFRRVKTNPILARVFGNIHCRVGILDQIHGGTCIGREHGNTDGRSYAEHFTENLHRLIDRVDDTAGDRRNFLYSFRIIENNYELVATQASHDI